MPIFKYVNGVYKKNVNGDCSNSVRVNGFKLKECRFGLDTSKVFFILRIEKCLNSCPERW